jgi:hypothetical protein
MDKWIVKRQTTGTYQCIDPCGIWRAEIMYKPKAARPWLVWRIWRNRDNSFKEYGGCDSFRTLAEAKDFVVNRPGVWGC